MMKRRSIGWAICLATACLSLAVLSGCARNNPRATKVTVAGEATSKVEPDTAVIVLSVVTQNSKALNAQQENARKSEAVATAVKASGGSGVEIKTSDYRLTPQYDYRDNRLPKIIGYDARNSVTVTTGDLKNVGAIIDAASGAGANSIDSIAFVLNQTSPARGQALAEATKQAKNKAQSIAEALGGRVLRVVEETENTAAIPGPFAYDETTRGGGGLSNRVEPQTPITAGSLNIRSTVQLIVEIET